MKTSKNAIALLSVMKTRGVGRKGALKIISSSIEKFSDYDAIDYIYNRFDLLGIEAPDLKFYWHQYIDLVDQWDNMGINIFSIHDKEYPVRLRNTPDPPAVIYVKGKIESLNAPHAVAIVGTREPTRYGCEVALKLGKISALNNFTVVSGLAHGCDTYGHKGCLNGNGIGIAVLAHGLDRIYPAANRGLAEELLENGGSLVSEYAPNVTPARTSFAERDRIQSGLSQGVLVIETDIKGGTMHTVKFARDQARPIACISHKEEMLNEEKTRGNQKLIKEKWAAPISNSNDYEYFLSELRSKERHEPLTKQERMNFQ